MSKNPASVCTTVDVLADVPYSEGSSACQVPAVAIGAKTMGIDT